MPGSETSTPSVALAAAASVALQPLLLRGRRDATLLGVSEHAAWAGLDGEVLVLSDRAAVRLPNAVELDVPAIGRWITDGAPVSVGSASVEVGGFTAVVRRWFDPSPALPRCTRAEIATRLNRFAATTGVDPEPVLLDALRSGDPVAVERAAVRIMGSGAGLTPEGDDVLAGALAAALLLGKAAGARMSVVEDAGTRLAAASRTRTTSFSGSLIRHALRGEVADPFAGALMAVAGRGDAVAAGETLLDVGGTSGRALAAGLLTGGFAVTQEPTP